MSNYQDIVKQGYLKTKSKNIGLWKKKWLILRRASSKGATRLERYADEKASMLTFDAKTMDLTYVERIERAYDVKQSHILVLCFTNGEMKHLAASSEMDLTDWYDVLIENIGPGAIASTSFPGQPAHNLPRDTFHVYLLPNTNTEYGGEYLLTVTAESLLLRDALYPAQTLVTWRLNTLRRYGKDGAKFTFEAGRSSQTGEGLFIFTSVDSDGIYQKVHLATQALVTVKSMTRRQAEGEGMALVTVKSMTRRQAEASMGDGSVHSVHTPPRTLARHHSDSENLASRMAHGGTASRGGGQAAGDSKSLPVSPVRGPAALPRKGTPKATYEKEEPDANANTQLDGYLYATPKEGRQTDFMKQVSRSDSRTDGRPLPPTPEEGVTSSSTSYTNGTADPDTYIYEEKGLTKDFRMFLAGRKTDAGDEEDEV